MRGCMQVKLSGVTAWVVLCVGLAALISPATAAETVTLRILSYNINDMPWPLRRKAKAQMKFIGRDLARRRAKGTAPDIVLLQEAFTNRSRQLVKKAGYPHVVRGPGRRKTEGNLKRGQNRRRTDMVAAGRGSTPRAYVGSGLYILSKYPVLQTKYELFGHYCSGNDCLANKAVLLARVQVPGLRQSLDIVTSHMDANKKKEASEKKRFRAHQRQTKIVKTFLDTFNGQRSAIFAGDLNVKNSKRYANFVQTIGAVNAGEWCLKTPKRCRTGANATADTLWRRTNDQHFILEGSDFRIVPVFMERNYDQRVKGKRLSDHLGFEAVYNVTPKR
ncbi:MAG: endonuclease/exonuclease/phosphatase family protein [Hyphomicrobiales bacterium]